MITSTKTSKKKDMGAGISCLEFLFSSQEGNWIKAVKKCRMRFMLTCKAEAVAHFQKKV